MPNVQKLFEKAEKFLQKQNFDSASKILLKLLEIEPENEAVLLNLAELALRRGRPDESVRYNKLLAQLYIRRNHTSKAIVTCRKILKLDAEDSEALERLGSLLWKTHKAPEASETFCKAMEIYRRRGDASKTLECLKAAAHLLPEDIEAHIQLAAVAGEVGCSTLEADLLLKAASLAREEQMKDLWIELARRACESDPTNEAARVAAAEAALAQNLAQEAIGLLQPLLSQNEGVTFLRVLCRSYLAAGDCENAESICLKLNRSDRETLYLTQQLIRLQLRADHTHRALTLIERIKGQMCEQEEGKKEFLALLEQIYRADENNLAVLELLPPLYSELNMEGPLRFTLARLFSLYLAVEQYEKAAETLDGILDVDPYGPGHSDRLLNLEGHIDQIRYTNIAGRISVPSAGRGQARELSNQLDDPKISTQPETLEDLIVEAEMYHRYHLSQKLDETLGRIDRLFPGAQEDNESLQDLHEAASFQPSPVTHHPSEDTASQTATRNAAARSSPKEVSDVSRITTFIHRQGTPEKILSAAAEQLGQLLNVSRCWIALGPPDSTLPVTAEWVASGIRPSDSGASLRVWSFLAHRTAGSEGWAAAEALGEAQLTPIEAEIHLLGIRSFLTTSLADREQPAGLLLLEQCDEARRWTPGEKLLAAIIGSQVMIACNNTKLRRLVRSLAGRDAATGLLPRSAYLDCLLEEARQAMQQSRPLSVCLLEPAGDVSTARGAAASDVRSYFRQLGGAVSSHLRQNDIAIRYGPTTIALCLPDTPADHCQLVIEKLQAHLAQDGQPPQTVRGFRAVVGDLCCQQGFDAVDAVTEIVNRLDAELMANRGHGQASILLSNSQS